MNFYNFVRLLVKYIFWIFWGFRIHGAENVPKSGAFLLCGNHRSNLDPVLIAAGCPRQLTFMAKEELFKNPLFGWLITKLGAFPIKRGKGDASAVMATLKILKRGNVTLIFPEGTRMKDGERKQINSGIIRLAIQTKVPIVPFYVGKHSVTFLEPQSYDQYAEDVKQLQKMQSLADEFMDKVYSVK